mmetsp:Transcript_110455/g.191492  ORF Transcript_110455/g.191492 Transcript_110455/m.191492 type:complete len:87 (+) Transcript_110455:1356-1616(+)
MRRRVMMRVADMVAKGKEARARVEEKEAMQMTGREAREGPTWDTPECGAPYFRIFHSSWVATSFRARKLYVKLCTSRYTVIPKLGK